MINLLPPRRKQEIRAGQTNVLLLRYCFISVVLTVLLFALAAGVYFILMDSKQAAQTTVDENVVRQQEYQQVQQDVSTFTQNLATAKSILDKEVRYSKIAVRIAQALPSGIVLQSLELNASTFGQQTTLNAMGRSHDDALRLKSALEASPDFDNVHLQSVSGQTQDSESTSPYSVSIAINVTMSPELAKL